jgi:hypothetical protein
VVVVIPFAFASFTVMQLLSAPIAINFPYTEH